MAETKQLKEMSDIELAKLVSQCYEGLMREQANIGSINMEIKRRKDCNDGTGKSKDRDTSRDSEDE